ncbi:MAG TPA: hypothetical protein VKZ45_08780, partial [Vicingaceae bacterium]|nr:hypothetical protein [Vicingaceae bacterium]
MSELKNVIGKKVYKIFYQSFYIENELISKYSPLYFQLDYFYKLVISEGEISFERINEEIKIIKLEEIKDEFKYPISELELDLDSKNEIKDVKIIIDSDNMAELGVAFEFGNKRLIFYNDIKE